MFFQLDECNGNFYKMTKFINFQNYQFQEASNFITCANRRHFATLQYLDLDLGISHNSNSTIIPQLQSSSGSTVYKTVDFLKTKAFNQTRQRVEEERKQCTDNLTQKDKNCNN